MRRVILLKSLRLRRALRIQALQHALVGGMLVLTGFEGFRDLEGSRLLAGFEILSGFLLFVAAAREALAKHHGVPAAVSLVDIFAGAVAAAEGLHRAHLGSHRVQFAYYLLSAAMLVRGLWHRRIMGLRRLELDPKGFFFRNSPFRSTRGRWRDVTEMREAPDAIEFKLAGRPQRLRTDDLENAREAREAILDYRDTIVALVRDVSPRLAECELTNVSRQPIDSERARFQHAAYVDLLASLGCAVRWLPPALEQPDSVFVEDTALVLDELAIVTRPGATVRQPEVASVSPVLDEYRPVRTVQAPGTLDGGDILVLGRRVFIGLSSRSNAAAVEQVQRWLAPLGYEVRGVTLGGCLHLKSAATAVGENQVLVNPAWVDPAVFAGAGIIEVDPAEPGGANALRIGRGLILPISCPGTRRRLEAAGLTVHGIDLSELAKAEGAVTCCSLVFRMVPVATPGPIPA